MLSSNFTPSHFDAYYLISLKCFSHFQRITCQSHSDSNPLTQANIMLGRFRDVTTKQKGGTIRGVEVKGCRVLTLLPGAPGQSPSGRLLNYGSGLAVDAGHGGGARCGP